MTDNAVTADKKPGGLKNIFVGSKGLRAGWGVSTFLMVFSAVAFGLVMVLHLFLHKKPDTDTLTPISTMIIEGIQAAVVLVATLITAALERRSLVALGFGLKNAVPRLVQGLLVGVVAMVGLIGLLYVCGAIKIGSLALHGADVWRYGAEWGVGFLLVGVSEELMFRGYLQQTLARGLNYRWAALIMGVLFLGAHVPNTGESPVGLAIVFAAGLVLSYSVWRTGAMWWGIGFHGAWDWMQSFTFGVADSGHPAMDALMISKAAGPDWLSGGSTGPEGSVLCLGVLIVVALIIHVTVRKPDADMGVKW
jgi:membrane protease YdiL (CAAX protease family)